MGVGGQRHAPAALPPGKTGYSLYKMLGEPQGGSGGGTANLKWKMSGPQGLSVRFGLEKWIFSPMGFEPLIMELAVRSVS
jgi:hypothetical protein